MKLYFFYIEECNWCHWVRDEVMDFMIDLPEYDHVKIHFINGQDFKNKAIGKNTGEEVAEKHGVYLYPTIIINNDDGNRLLKVIGVASMDEYWYNLDKILLNNQ